MANVSRPASVYSEPKVVEKKPKKLKSSTPKKKVTKKKPAPKKPAKKLAESNRRKLLPWM